MWFLALKLKFEKKNRNSLATNQTMRRTCDHVMKALLPRPTIFTMTFYLIIIHLGIQYKNERMRSRKVAVLVKTCYQSHFIFLQLFAFIFFKKYN